MSEQAARRFSQGEISILRMLWEEGEATLSEAHHAMESRGHQIGYTTVQTRLERLVAKRAVAKSRSRPARYSAAVSPEQVSGAMLDWVVERVSGPVPLVAQLLQDPSLTPGDLAELKRLIAEAEKNLGQK